MVFPFLGPTWLCCVSNDPSLYRLVELIHLQFLFVIDFIIDLISSNDPAWDVMCDEPASAICLSSYMQLAEYMRRLLILIGRQALLYCIHSESCMIRRLDRSTY